MLSRLQDATAGQMCMSFLLFVIRYMLVSTHICCGIMSMNLTSYLLQLVWNSSADLDLKGLCCGGILYCMADTALQCSVPLQVHHSGLLVFRQC